MSDDTHSNERPGFAERAAKLAGRTTYREPVGGYGTSLGHMPDEHAIAAAFAYGRKGPNDIGPDIALSIITGTQAHRTRIVVELAAALLIQMPRVSRGEEDAVIEVAADCFLRVVAGTGSGKPEGMNSRAYESLAALGDSILFAAADDAISRARRAYSGRVAEHA